MTTSRVTKAWLVRWEWSGPHAAVDQPVAAILRPQLGAAQVRRIVEGLYAARQYEPDEMLDAMRPRGNQPYPASFGSVAVNRGAGRVVHVPWQGEIMCGHNPYLVARLARTWPAKDGSGRIDWEDEPRPGA